MKFDYYQNTDRWETMHFKTCHYKKCLLILMSWNYFRNTAHEFWYTLYYARKSQSVLPAGFNSDTGFLLVTWRCANIACQFNGQIYLKKLILSFNKILLLSIREVTNNGVVLQLNWLFCLFPKRTKSLRRWQLCTRFRRLKVQPVVLVETLAFERLGLSLGWISIVKVYICVCKTL